MKYAKVIFPKGEVLIELLNTPVVTKWAAAIEIHNKYNDPYMVRIGTFMYHNQPTRNYKFQEKCVENINIAIDNLNKTIEGRKFPYRAYTDMPWMQTNRIHRCFTTGHATPFQNVNKWSLNLTHTQLKEWKELAISNIQWKRYKEFEGDQYKPEFKIFNRIEYEKNLHIINKYVHLYENKRHSQRANMTSYNYFTKFIKKPQDTKRIDLSWDVYIPTGDKLKTFKQLNGPNWALNKEEIIASFPDNYEDYNVIILKSITGKDYEQCYQEYDDPLEWDVQNIENIGGGISIILNSYPREHMNFYKRSDYSTWLKQYSIREEFVLPVPIGKVVEDNVNLQFDKKNGIYIDPKYYNTDDSPGVIKPYRNPRIELL